MKYHNNNLNAEMGIYLSKLFNLMSELGRGRNRRVLMLGLDAAGKTTVLYKLKLNENVSTIPTIGFNVEEVTVGKGLTMTIWDVGGQERIRELWRHYYANCEALIYVVDSNDRERMRDASKELMTILDNDEMTGVPVVVLANKQDLPNSMSPAMIADELALRKLGQGHNKHDWHIQACCAVSGDGLYEGMEAVARLSDDFYKRHRHH